MRATNNRRETWGKDAWKSCGQKKCVCNSFFVPFDPAMLQKSPYEVRGTSRRGVRRSQKPLQALRSGGSEGEKQPTFDPARSSHVRCLARHAGHREVVKKAQALAAAKRRSPSGTARCSVARAPARPEPQGVILADSSWRAAVERTSVSGGRPALRGTRRNRRPQRLAHRVRAVRHTRFVREMRKGLPSSSRARTDDKGVRGRFEEGICALKGPRTFARVGRSTEPVRLRTHVDRVARRSRFSARGSKGRT